jgi:hypothetical protein
MTMNPQNRSQKLAKNQAEELFFDHSRNQTDDYSYFILKRLLKDFYNKDYYISFLFINLKIDNK